MVSSKTIHLGPSHRIERGEMGVKSAFIILRVKGVGTNKQRMTNNRGRMKNPKTRYSQPIYNKKQCHRNHSCSDTDYSFSDVDLTLNEATRLLNSLYYKEDYSSDYEDQSNYSRNSNRHGSAQSSFNSSYPDNFDGDAADDDDDEVMFNNRKDNKTNENRHSMQKDESLNACRRNRCDYEANKSQEIKCIIQHLDKIVKMRLESPMDISKKIGTPDWQATPPSFHTSRTERRLVNQEYRSSMQSSVSFLREDLSQEKKQNVCLSVLNDFNHRTSRLEEGSIPMPYQLRLSSPTIQDEQEEERKSSDVAETTYGPARYHGEFRPTTITPQSRILYAQIPSTPVEVEDLSLEPTMVFGKREFAKEKQNVKTKKVQSAVFVCKNMDLVSDTSGCRLTSRPPSIASSSYIARKLSRRRRMTIGQGRIGSWKPQFQTDCITNQSPIDSHLPAASKACMSQSSISSRRSLLSGGPSLLSVPGTSRATSTPMKVKRRITASTKQPQVDQTELLADDDDDGSGGGFEAHEQMQKRKTIDSSNTHKDATNKKRLLCCNLRLMKNSYF